MRLAVILMAAALALPGSVLARNYAGAPRMSHSTKRLPLVPERPKRPKSPFSPKPLEPLGPSGFKPFKKPRTHKKITDFEQPADPASATANQGG